MDLSDKEPVMLNFFHTASIRFKWVCLLFLSIFILSGCKQPPARRANTTPTVAVVNATTMKITRSRDFVARTKAVSSVNLVARVEGHLVKRNFIEGELVKKDQVLFEIAPREFRIAVNKAQADLDMNKAKAFESERNLARGSTLIKKKLISQEAYDALVSVDRQMKANLSAAEAALEQAQLNLSYTRIKAPFEGRTGLANYHVGSLVGPADSQSLAEIISVDPIYACFEVTESDFRKYLSNYQDVENLKSRLKLTLKLSDNSTYPVPGVINFIDPKIDSETDTVTVRASFPNPRSILRPGMYANLNITDTQELIQPVLPQIAIQHGKNGAFVYTVDDNNQVVAVPVTAGSEIGALQAIASGLTTANNVIVQGFMNIRNGSKVKTDIAQFDRDGNITIREKQTKSMDDNKGDSDR